MSPFKREPIDVGGFYHRVACVTHAISPQLIGVDDEYVWPRLTLCSHTRVEYEITEFGRSLEPILRAMQQWGREFKSTQRAAELAHEIPVAEKAA